MNFRLVVRQFGLLLGVLCVCMGGAMAWSLGQWWSRGVNAEKMAALSLLVSIAIGLGLSCILWLIGRPSKGLYIGRREAMLLVSSSWLFGAAFCALPYYLWAILDRTHPATHEFIRFADCYFESMSGLTTTGATILSDITTIPQGLLLWRALTHWLGGLGIVVLFVAVLPLLGVGGKRLFQIETTGLRPQGVRPRIAETARALWLIYLGITVAAILCLRATGAMGWFDSACHALSMVSTGGLSTRDASIGYYNSVAVDIVCIVFMLLAGVNFALFYMLVQGRFSAAWKDTELRVYLALKLAVIAVVALNLLGWPIVTTTGQELGQAGIGDALRYGAFQTVALHTGTGFVTADYDPWPFLSRVLLVGLMFIGGCAGSTAGGIKVIRFWVTLKVVAGEIEKMFRPNVVRTMRVGSAVVDRDTAASAVTYFLTMVLLFAIGAFLIAQFESGEEPADFLTAMSASVSTLCNVGPGLHGVGATQTYSWFSTPSKIVMSLLMALGRLEIFTLFVLILPRFWRGD